MGRLSMLIAGGVFFLEPIKSMRCLVQWPLRLTEAVTVLLSWDTQSGQDIHRFTHGRRVILVTLEAPGQDAFTTDSAKRSIVWDLSTGQERSQLQYFHRHEAFSVARFVNDNQWLITGSPTRALKLWDASTGNIDETKDYDA